MPNWLLAVLLGLCAVVSLGAGIWLLLHLQALASLFSRHGELTPGPSRPRASRRAVWLALIVFNAGWIAAAAIWLFAMAGPADPM